MHATGLAVEAALRQPKKVLAVIPGRIEDAN
jgi:hypothetical protein